MSNLGSPEQGLPRSGTMDVRMIVSMAFFTAIAFIITVISKSLPNVYDFLGFDFKDTIVCIAGFTFGPLSAAIVSFLASTIEMMTISGTGPIGLLMNVLATCAFACTASIVYKRMHSYSGAVLGLLLGCLAMTGTMLLWNYLITPLYQGVPRDAIAGMLLPVFLPFNLVKSGLNMACTLALYKPVVTALRKANLLPPSQARQSGGFHVGFAAFTLVLLATFVLIALVLMGVI